ncbi:MAG: type II toxin-antitoxin system VapC family toxin [bacterium]|nr:type II toxin-antitoxin system VapC family toxin [bacterium]
MIVVDTNIISYFYLNGTYSGLAERVFEKDPEWAAPFLWRSEFRNVLALYIRKKIITLKNAQRIMTEAESLMEGREYSVISDSVLQLVGQSTCSAYDCEFAVLANDLGVPFLTMDKKLLKSFPGIAVCLDDFLS